MKILAILVALMPATATSLPNDTVTENICEYHASIVTDTTDLLLKGNDYEEAAETAIQLFRDKYEDEELQKLNENLSVVDKKDLSFVGTVTGRASIYWYKLIAGEKIIATYERLHYNSYSLCMKGSEAEGVLQYFKEYDRALDRMMAISSPVS